MGLIISRFRRKKTTTEVLERLETDIKRIEQDGVTKEQKHKRITGTVMAFSVGLYVLFALLYYFKYIGKSQYWMHSVLYASPLLLLPVLVIFLRNVISWYFNWSLGKTRVKLGRMREEKKKILEEVMNTETYKVAKQILDKYGGEDRSLKPFIPSLNVPGTPPSPLPATPGQLRQRQLSMQTSTPIRNMSLAPVNNTPGKMSMHLPRPLPEQHRSALDKVVDYLLKDGPNFRMALICGECKSHNGMAMIEEFDFVSYKCAYCGAWNPSRRQRPAAPPLRAPAALRAAESGSESEESGGSRPPSPAPRAPSPAPAEAVSPIALKQD